MPRDRHHWEERTSSHWEPGPGNGRSYSDAYSWRHYAPPTELPPRRSFNYWRDEAVAPTSYYPQRPYERDEQWHDNGRSWHAESSYSRGQRNFRPARDWDDREPRRDRSPPYRNPSCQYYSTNTAPPHIPRPRNPIESIPPLPKPTPPDPPRKASPPPTKSSQRSKPSPGYLSVSQAPSEPLQDPGTSRKLLVLDLNGTLLIRSARSRVASGPQLRPVQPRPYMQSFQQYLFCLETKAWLDTMVWSSAQPHSVNDMVDKVFGATKNELKAVWNRKSLGLSEAEYHQKTATMKDLTKPWDLLASALSPEKFKGHSAVPSQSQAIHSAFTTLLLDDSPHKAALQPYNHVCIPEYDRMRRQHDLRSLLSTKEPKGSEKAQRKNQVEIGIHSTDEMVPVLSPRGALSEIAKKEPYDATLLAVIGILDAVKLQNNVAGWIRKGGLWAAQERREGLGTLDVKHHSVVKAEDGKTASNTVVPTGNDTSSTSDPIMTPEQAHAQRKMWFDDSSVVTYWVARGRRTLMELGIQVVHGVTG
ncbi:hypothetical protein J3R82DRAFT_7841 [Butyriboletus roseoflavus]|nr:hypothetical protein J3R82DRAFT_7841 [Butyriboletus roseoflavus]